MKEAKHTPGPWKPTNSWSRYGTDEIEDHEMMNYSSQVMARAPFTENEESDIPGELVEEQSVATAHGRTPEEVKANAEFIARACNAHDDLLEACKAFVDYYTQAGIGDCHEGHADGCDGSFDGDERFNVRGARAAIAKAEGRKP